MSFLLDVVAGMAGAYGMQWFTSWRATKTSKTPKAPPEYRCLHSEVRRQDDPEGEGQQVGASADEPGQQRRPRGGR